jgi:hypothetical protein
MTEKQKAHIENERLKALNKKIMQEGVAIVAERDGLREALRHEQLLTKKWQDELQGMKAKYEHQTN